MPVVIVLLVVIALAYVGWYSFNRHTKLANNAACDRTLSQPQQGMPQKPCLYQVVPPHLLDLARGQFVFNDLPPRFTVTIPRSIVDILLGNYSLQPAELPGCDQSATTTDCSKLQVPSQPEPQPYVPPNPVQPSKTWVSAARTPISLAGFSFELPAGWHGSVYNSAYLGSVHVLVQKDSNDRGFSIDCPPDGKGLEAATRLTSETRTFTSGGTDYSAAFEKWTAPGNNPWYFIWVRMPQSGDSSNGSLGTYCLVQGTVTPDIEEAMRTMYESLK